MIQKTSFKSLILLNFTNSNQIMSVSAISLQGRGYTQYLLFVCIAVFLSLDVLSCSLLTTTSSSEDTTVNIILSLHFNRCVDIDSPPKGNYLSLSCLKSLLFAVLLQWKNPFRTIKNLPGYLISSLSLTFTVTYQQQDSCYSTSPVNFKWS